MTQSAPQRKTEWVRVWLFAVAGLVLLTVIVGGATRLTESGLSIVEWKPVTGVLPPFSDAEWNAEFDKYKAIPQYRELNSGMSLAEFKSIYWWEWLHRLLGRLTGAAFLLPFLYFLWRGAITPLWQMRLWSIFALGAFQGAVGWWMVTSGLTERVNVSQYRLAFHLTLACVIYAALVWSALRLKRGDIVLPEGKRRTPATALLWLVLAQIYLGALVAGLDAGLSFNTWPLIDGTLVPTFARLFFEDPPWRNFFENALMVQFNHRMIAYVLLAAVWLHVLDMRRNGPGGAGQGALMLGLAVTAQAGIGIATLLLQVPLPLALLHQAAAILVLTLAVIHAERLSAALGQLRQAPQR